MWRRLRWITSICLVIVGFTVSWAWGEVARLAEPLPQAPEPQAAVLYAVWQPEGGTQSALFRRSDEAAPWQPVALPSQSAPQLWADNGRERVAVVLADGSLLVSRSQGEDWFAPEISLSVLSLVWDRAGNLYLGTKGEGVYWLSDEGSLGSMAGLQGELAKADVQHLAQAGGRLFALTPTALFYVDTALPWTGGPQPEWVKSTTVPAGVLNLAATGPQILYAGTQTQGVYKSVDGGQTWRAANDGLGLAAGQMVRITAMRADPQEPEVLYSAVSYVVGSTHVHASAQGVFVTLNGGGSWQSLSGPSFPEAASAAYLLVAVNRPLYIGAVAPTGLTSYDPDVGAAMASLEQGSAEERLASAHLLGLAGNPVAGKALLAALADDEPSVGLAAAHALGRIDDLGTVPGLLVALEHPNEQVRLGAARALGLLGSEASVGPLRTMLLKGEGTSIMIAADSLAQIGSPAATDALLAATTDPYMTSRRHAAQAALEQMGEQAVIPLVEVLASEDGYARRNAAQILGWIGSPEATQALIVALRDNSPAIRGQAAWALGQIGDAQAIAALERLSARDSAATVRQAAEEALARIKVRPTASAGWPSSWAPALNRLQAVRWLVLGLFLAAAAWLAVGSNRLSPVVPRGQVLRR
jgi:HEAT repeat protein